MHSSVTWRIAFPLSMLIWAAPCEGGKCRAQTKASPATRPTEARSADRAAVRSALDALVKSFEARDARLLAASWTAEGEYKNEAGVTVRGREGLEKAFGEFFAKTPEVKAKLRSESLRFVGNDSAIDEGLVTIHRGPVTPATSAQYSALLVREDGRWRVAQLQESPPADAASVEELSWLIGEWQASKADGAEIRTTYSWLPGKKFIQVQFSIQESALSLSGSQIIGVDPATGALRSWTFEADGGVGEAEWNRDGNHWVLDVTGTLNDGRTLTETNVLRRVNEDTLTWQSVGRRLDDVEIPDLAPVKVTRLRTKK